MSHTPPLQGLVAESAQGNFVKMDSQSTMEMGICILNLIFIAMDVSKTRHLFIYLSKNDDFLCTRK